MSFCVETSHVYRRTQYGFNKKATTRGKGVDKIEMHNASGQEGKIPGLYRQGQHGLPRLDLNRLMDSSHGRGITSNQEDNHLASREWLKQ